MSALTKYQKRLIRELRELYELFALDFYDIESYPKEERTTRLELMRRAVVRAQVVMFYTLVDEYLSSELCIHFFGTKKSFPELWKTKKFQRFNYHFLEELSLLPKLRYVKALREVPKATAREIDKLNALRNGVAHAYFPENLKRSRAVWDGNDIFSLQGVKAFDADMRNVIRFFQKIRYGRY